VRDALASGVGPEAEPVLISAERLDGLLRILPRGHRLLLDTRPDAARQKRWLDDSVHFRVPADFIARAASLDQVGCAFAAQRDMDRFARWREACCIVFYAEDVEFAWECPAADALLDKLRAAGWGGRCFVLAGQFGRFRRQFPQHVQSRKDSVGAAAAAAAAADAGAAAAAASSSPAPSNPPSEVQAYEAWLAQVDGGAAAPPHSSDVLAPSAINDRRRAAEEFERTLADEFTRRFPVLYKESHVHEERLQPFEGAAPAAEGKGKGKLVEDGAAAARQAALAAPLERGLERMRAAAAVDGSTAASAAAKVAAIEGGGCGGGGDA
jgi:hypothetical protein